MSIAVAVGEKASPVGLVNGFGQSGSSSVWSVRTSVLESANSQRKCSSVRRKGRDPVVGSIVGANSGRKELQRTWGESSNAQKLCSAAEQWQVTASWWEVRAGSSSAMVVTAGWHGCGTTCESVTVVSSGPEEKSAADPLQETEAVPEGDVPEGSSSARVVTSGWHKECWNTVEGVTMMACGPQEETVAEPLQGTV